MAVAAVGARACALALAYTSTDTAHEAMPHAHDMTATAATTDHVNAVLLVSRRCRLHEHHGRDAHLHIPTSIRVTSIDLDNLEGQQQGDLTSAISSAPR